MESRSPNWSETTLLLQNNRRVTKISPGGRKSWLRTTGRENIFPYPHGVKGDPIKAPLIMKNKEWGTLTAAEKAVAILWVSLGIRDDSMTAIKDYEDPPATRKGSRRVQP